MDLASFRDRVDKVAESMPSQLRKASAVLLQNPDDVALLSMRELALRAELPPSTFVRLARLLGFKGYSDLRGIFVEQLRQMPRLYSERAELLQARENEDSDAALLREIFIAKIRNVELTFEKNTARALARVVKLIERARRVFLLGQRSCYPIAYFFDYVYRLFAAKAVLVEDAGGTCSDRLRDIGNKDVLIVVSLRPYTLTSVRAAEFAEARGCSVISITDDELSPLTKLSRQVLFADPTSPSFFHSILSPLVLMEILLALLMARGGAQALTQLAASEDQLDRFGAYWKPGNSRRKR